MDHTQPTAPYVPGSDTSQAAAESIAPHLSRLQDRLLGLIRDRGGATVDELIVATGLVHQTVGPRVRELFLKGRVRDSGQRRPTRRGRKATVWIVGEVVP